MCLSFRSFSTLLSRLRRSSGLSDAVFGELLRARRNLTGLFLMLSGEGCGLANKLYADALYTAFYVPGQGRLVNLTGSYKF